MNMKSLLGTANKWIGKGKGFIVGNISSSSEDSQQTQSSEENNLKDNASKNTKNTTNTQPQKNPIPNKPPKRRIKK